MRAIFCVIACGLCAADLGFLSARAPALSSIPPDKTASLIVGSISSGCCVRAWRRGCACEPQYATCRSAPFNCGSGNGSWGEPLWCLNAYCNPPVNTGDQCELTASGSTGTVGCANMCRASGTTSPAGHCGGATECTSGQERCEFDMYTYDDRLCTPGEDCPEEESIDPEAPGYVSRDDHCSVIQVCKTGQTLVECPASLQRGASCN